MRADYLAMAEPKNEDHNETADKPSNVTPPESAKPAKPVSVSLDADIWDAVLGALAGRRRSELIEATEAIQSALN